jgi:hypothetical protein
MGRINDLLRRRWPRNVALLAVFLVIIAVLTDSPTDSWALIALVVLFVVLGAMELFFC